MVRISKIVCMFAVVILMGEAAYAAESAAVRSPQNWSGIYVGAFVAHSWVKLNYYEPDYPGYERNPNFTGFTGGPFLGYNFKTDKVILGVEGDAGFGRVSESADPSAFNYYSAYDINWNAHARMRIGWNLDATLLYVAGGLAFAGVTVDDTDAGYGKDDATHVGWTIGAGIEHAITRNLRVRAEYLYDDYGSKSYTITGPANYFYRSNVNLTAHILRAGLSFYF